VWTEVAAELAADGAEVGSSEGGKASQVGKSEVGKAWKRISQIQKSGAPPLRAQKVFSKPRLTAISKTIGPFFFMCVNRPEIEIRSGNSVDLFSHAKIIVVIT
jgi:hypothetical protein